MKQCSHCLWKRSIQPIKFLSELRFLGWIWYFSMEIPAPSFVVECILILVLISNFIYYTLFTSTWNHISKTIDVKWWAFQWCFENPFSTQSIERKEHWYNVVMVYFNFLLVLFTDRFVIFDSFNFHFCHFNKMLLINNS